MIGKRIGEELLGIAAHADRAVLDRGVLRSFLALRVARIAPPRRHLRHDRVEEVVELLLDHLADELHALDAGLREALAPLPLLQLAQLAILEDDLVAQERELEHELRPLELLHGLERQLRGLRARRMCGCVERHRRERLPEGVKEANRICHSVSVWEGGGAHVAVLRFLCALEHRLHIRRLVPSMRETRRAPRASRSIFGRSFMRRSIFVRFTA